MAVGGGKNRAASARAVVESGIAVMGHVGLLPQSISVLGGFRPQGQSATSALKVIEDALVGLVAPSHLHVTAMQDRLLLSSMHDVAISGTEIFFLGWRRGVMHV